MSLVLTSKLGMLIIFLLLDKLAQEKKEWKSERETLIQEVEAKKQEKLRYQVIFLNFQKKTR